MDKDHKHGYEKTYEESEKRMKRSSCSQSSDEDDANDDVSVQESTHQCNVCGKTFSNGKALGGHRRSHFLKKKLNHRSQKVETPLSMQGSYNRSIFDKDRKHGFENTCEESEKRIKRSCSLSSDEDDAKDEVSIQEPTHQCNVCGKTFSNGKALGGHRRSHFLKQKLHHHSQKVETPFSIQGNNNMASFDKDHKHDREDTYEESEKRMKRSACVLSSDEDEAKNEVSVQEPTHQCNVCGKTFSNGKSLGGHRRSHFLKKKLSHQPQKVKTPFSTHGSNNRASFDDYDDEKEIDGIEKRTCSLCKKEFPTKNALYGHMRSHPNRDVKGLNPPTEHHKEDQDDGNLSLPKWQKRDKRGRKCIGSAEAAANLLLLRYDRYFCVGESSSNGNGKNELGCDRNSADKQLKKGKGIFDLNESYVIED